MLKQTTTRKANRVTENRKMFTPKPSGCCENSKQFILREIDVSRNIGQVAVHYETPFSMPNV